MTNKLIHPVCCAALEFDLELGVISNSRKETQRLSPVNLKLLTYLLAHQNQVVSRTELFDAVWPNQLLSEDVLTRAISDIRTQLAKLDADTKYIETLPKRGYRWCIEPRSLLSSEVDGVVIVPADSQADIQFSSAPANSWLKFAAGCLLLAIMLAAALMWGISQAMETHAVKLAVLPAVVDRPSLEPLAQAVDDALLNSLRKNTKVKLLSASAINSRPQNPFPYFANEFGAAWVIESRVTDLDGVDSVELCLVDARTGIVVRNFTFEIANRADILHKVAKKLDSDLLVDQLAY